MAISEASSVTPDTVTGSAYELMDSMSIPPGAGTYLLVWSGSISHSALTSSVNVAVHVAGSPLTHTEREFTNEASLETPNPTYPVGIACKVEPTAGQAVAIYWKTSAATATVYERNLVLIPVAS